MRVTLAGAEITDSMVDVIETIQTSGDIRNTYLSVIDEVTRMVILDLSGLDAEDSIILKRLRTLQMIRRDISTLSTPPDADLPENDVPAFQA